MSVRLKSALKCSAIFLIGLVVGAVLLESLEIYLRPAYRALIIRSHLMSEQEFLASRATRENRQLDAAFHRGVVVNAESETGFTVFRVPNSELDDKQYLYLPGMLALKSMWTPERVMKEKVAEGLNRGKLAVALEALGQNKEAEYQWQLSQLLLQRKTIEETKATVYPLLELEKSDLYLGAEDKILGKPKK